MLAFDAPSREECTADRSRSNTPLQALVLLNDPTYVEAARALAELIVREGGATTDARLEYAFQRALSRPIRASEAAVLGELRGQAPRAISARSGSGGKAAGRRRPAATGRSRPGRAGRLDSVARAILNLHEMVTRN